MVETYTSREAHKMKEQRSNGGDAYLSSNVHLRDQKSFLGDEMV